VWSAKAKNLCNTWYFHLIIYVDSLSFFFTWYLHIFLVISFCIVFIIMLVLCVVFVCCVLCILCIYILYIYVFMYYVFVYCVLWFMYCIFVYCICICVLCFYSYSKLKYDCFKCICKMTSILEKVMNCLRSSSSWWRTVCFLYELFVEKCCFRWKMQINYFNVTNTILKHTTMSILLVFIMLQ
jgi:hypothetical protein